MSESPPSTQSLVLSLVNPMKSHITTPLRCLFAVVLFASTLTFAADAQDGPKNAVVLIIRHGEKPDSGPDLSPRGQQRAEAYKDYFLNFTVDSKPLRPNAIFAAKELKGKPSPQADGRAVCEGREPAHR